MTFKLITYENDNFTFHILLLEATCALALSRPRSWSDPIGESEPVSGCETIYWDFFFSLFFFSELNLYQ